MLFIEAARASVTAVSLGACLLGSDADGTEPVVLLGGGFLALLDLCNALLQAREIFVRATALLVRISARTRGTTFACA